jgi:hypothetical protein
MPAALHGQVRGHETMAARLQPYASEHDQEQWKPLVCGGNRKRADCRH